MQYVCFIYSHWGIHIADKSQQDKFAQIVLFLPLYLFSQTDGGYNTN